MQQRYVFIEIELNGMRVTREHPLVYFGDPNEVPSKRAIRKHYERLGYVVGSYIKAREVTR